MRKSNFDGSRKRWRVKGRGREEKEDDVSLLGFLESQLSGSRFQGWFCIRCNLQAWAPSKSTSLLKNVRKTKLHAIFFFFVRSHFLFQIRWTVECSNRDCEHFFEIFQGNCLDPRVLCCMVLCGSFESTHQENVQWYLEDLLGHSLTKTETSHSFDLFYFARSYRDHSKSNSLPFLRQR